MTDEARRRLMADLERLPPDLFDDVARFASALALVHGRRVGLPNPAMVAVTRGMVARGAGHECEEWWDAHGRCALCDRVRGT